MKHENRKGSGESSSPRRWETLYCLNVLLIPNWEEEGSEDDTKSRNKRSLVTEWSNRLSHWRLCLLPHALNFGTPICSNPFLLFEGMKSWSCATFPRGLRSMGESKELCNFISILAMFLKFRAGAFCILCLSLICFPFLSFWRLVTNAPGAW